MNKIKTLLAIGYSALRTTVGTIVVVAIAALLIQHYVLANSTVPAPTFKNLAICEGKGLFASAWELVSYPFHSVADIQVEKGWFSQTVTAVFAGQKYLLGNDGIYHPAN